MYENKKEDFSLIYEENADYANVILPLPKDNFNFSTIEKEEPINIDNNLSSSFEYESELIYKLKGEGREYGSKEIYENEFLFFIEESEENAYLRPVNKAYLFQMRLKSTYEEEEEEKKVEEDSVVEESNEEEIIERRRILTGGDIEKIIRKNKVTIKKLLVLLKNDFLIDDRAKKTVQVFLKNKCSFTDGKYLILK